MLYRLADAAPGPRRTIAVVGSGIAGLSAAWLLAQRHQVTLFEKEGWAGGHSNTVEVETEDGPIPVDTGFIVYNAPNYPNLVALFDHLRVATKPSDMSFSASLRDGALEYSSDGLNRLFGQRANLVRPQFWTLLRDIVRFYARARQHVEKPGIDAMTLGDFLDSSGFSRSLAEDHVLPMCAAIWSTTSGSIRDMPLRAYLRFFSSHGLLDIGSYFEWRTVVGGSREYVKRLTARFAHRILSGCGAKSVRRTGGFVEIGDMRGTIRRFDHVVIATHADQALRMLSDADSEERQLLGSFRYSANEAVLHSDAALMPARRRAWSSWNYLTETAGENRKLSVTYWMNRLQSLPADAPLFVTLNPLRQPREVLVKRRETYEHPLFDVAAMAAQKRLWSLQGGRNAWFCGAYFGAGFHEDGLQSGLAVAEALGGVRRPWKVVDESGRIQVHDIPRNRELAAA